jgi:hypothetical protein
MSTLRADSSRAIGLADALVRRVVSPRDTPVADRAAFAIDSATLTTTRSRGGRHAGSTPTARRSLSREMHETLMAAPPTSTLLALLEEARCQK